MQKVYNHPQFCKNLIRLRKGKNYTQDAVVAKMQLLGSSMSRSTYSKIETGARNIKVTDLVCLKIVLDVEYENLFEGISPE